MYVWVSTLAPSILDRKKTLRWKMGTLTNERERAVSRSQNCRLGFFPFSGLFVFGLRGVERFRWKREREREGDKRTAHVDESRSVV